jgi:hypothetical protein
LNPVGLEYNRVRDLIRIPPKTVVGLERPGVVVVTPNCGLKGIFDEEYAVQSSFSQLKKREVDTLSAIKTVQFKTSAAGIHQ